MNSSRLLEDEQQHWRPEDPTLLTYVLHSNDALAPQHDVTRRSLSPASTAEIAMAEPLNSSMECVQKASNDSGNDSPPTANRAITPASSWSEFSQNRNLSDIQRKANGRRRSAKLPRKSPPIKREKKVKMDMRSVLPTVGKGQSAFLPHVTAAETMPFNQEDCYKAVSQKHEVDKVPVLSQESVDDSGVTSYSEKASDLHRKPSHKKRSLAGQPILERVPLTEDTELEVLAVALDVSGTDYETSADSKTKKRRNSEAGPRVRRSKKCTPKCKLYADSTHFMVGCDGCRKWFHGSCINLTKKQADIYTLFYCATCVKDFGPSVKRKRTNNFLHDYFDVAPLGKPIETGTEKFLEDLNQKKDQFRPLADVVEVMKGYQLDMEHMRNSGFKKLIFIEDKAGLDLTVPEGEFAYEDVVKILGEDRTVSAIDVESQEENVIITLSQYLNYMRSEPRETILNVISLEFSKSAMSKYVEPPRIVKELSWVDNYFKEEQEEDYPPESPYAKPEVQKYCLMSAKNSFTDFHIDFGGTSVWYHIFRGSKVFYLIEPTEKNLALYEEWMKAKNQASRFLGDETDCFKLELKQGHTILMPSGWIHAVFTPEDSLVFGGNFLHHLAAETQFTINQMEDRLQTPARYRFPHFYTVCWSAFNELLDLMEEKIEQSLETPDWLLRATGVLYNTLKDESPETVSPEELKRRKDEVKEDIDWKRLLRKANDLIKKSAFKHAAAKGIQF